MHSKGGSHHPSFQQREYTGLGKLANSPVVYQQVGPMGNQYMNSQPVYYPSGPVMNAPPTPFDTAYGVTLLPSHLLMGSPFVSSPDLFQQSHHQQQRRQSYNSSKFSSGRNFGKVATAYPAPPPLNPPPASRRAAFPVDNRGLRRDSYYNSIQGSDAAKLFKEPFVLSYTILPKGKDEFRTRSLLLENVNESIDLHSFVSNYTKFGPVESVYLFKNDNEGVSILLSFFSRKICLDFYNNVLQRLSEFKSDLDSKSLTLSFVSLEYKVPGTNEEDVENEEDTSADAFNITAAGSLRYDIINRGASRSIAITFKKPCSKDGLMNKVLDFLSPSKNIRYVLESIDLVTAKESTKHFPQNYAILTFLNISMAVEILDYIRLHSQKLKISKSFFVSVLPQKTDGKRLSISSSNGKSLENITGNYQSKNASLTSLDSSGSFLSIDHDIDNMTNKLQRVQLEKHILKIENAEPTKTSFESHTDHMSNVNISEAASLDSEFPLPSPQEVSVNEIALSPQELTLSGEIGYAQNLDNSSPMVPLSSLGNAPYSCYMGLSNGRQNSNMTKPITQSLQKQYATSTEVASSMGGGIGNRTVYIGNIHPRSKAEDICNVVRGGILQNIKFLPEKHICFVTFVEAVTAVQFYTNAFIDPIVLHGNMLKVGWGHHSGPLPKSIALAVTVGASRNVYVSLPEYAFKDKYINDPQYQEYNQKFKLPNEQQLRKDFSHYGDIEQINYLNDGHCCWVNFMNISAAIKLVEEVNYEDGEGFHKLFNERYEGLVIGYGKDRCGNVNKNLVAGKNSRFYKKVKKPSYNIRLSKMEEERRQNEDNLRRHQRNNSEKLLQFGSLGITLEGNGMLESEEVSDIDYSEEIDYSDSHKKTVERKIGKESDQEEKELFKLSNKSQTLNGLGLCESSQNDLQESECIQEVGRGSSIDGNLDIDEDSLKSDVSSDIELIIHSPVDEKVEQRNERCYKNKSNDRRKYKAKQEGLSPRGESQQFLSEGASAVSNPSLEANPPMAPATISRNYSLMFKKQYNNERLKESAQSTTNDNVSQREPNGGNETHNHSRRKRHSKKQYAKSIPGSDVMAQYLAQLQHSTFIYAANILGASNDGDNGYLDENTGS